MMKTYRRSPRLAPFLSRNRVMPHQDGPGRPGAHMLTALCPKLLSTSLAITPDGWACEQWVLLAQIYPLLGHIMLQPVSTASPTQESM